MLILTRKIGESIVIGNKEIEITVLNINGNQVRIGVNADKDIPVHREEIFHQIKRSRENAIQQKGNNICNVPQKLIDQARLGDTEAEFTLGKLLFEQKRYGFAKAFLKMAADKKHVLAQKYLQKLYPLGETTCAVS